jgi:hypothetical protein
VDEDRVAPGQCGEAPSLAAADQPDTFPQVGDSTQGWTRRRILATGVGAAAAIVAGGFELVDHGVLPGKHILDTLDGACSVPAVNESFRRPGPILAGSYFSKARNREVGYTLAYPPGHPKGSRLPLGLYLHADGGNHSSTLGGLVLNKALAGSGIGPMALIAADGGDLYWNPHPGDNPLAAISPAIWTSYGEAAHANPAAYASGEDFARDNVITHARSLAQTPVRIASGNDDPFHPGVIELTKQLGANATIELTGGCHDDAFFASQQYVSLQFLSQHIAHA